MYEKYRNELNKIFNKYNQGSDVYSDELHEFSKFLLGQKQKEKAPKLYRYSKTDFYNLRGLETDRLFLSKAGEMNDIFEGIQIADDNPPDYEEMKKISGVIRLKSFCETNDSLYMWGNYGDKCRGMCVKYDLNYLCNNDKFFNGLYPVLYFSERIKGEFRFGDMLECIENCNKGNKQSGLEELSEMDALYLIKSKEWEQEKEWRFIRNIYNIQEERESEYIQISCITEVYLGYRIDPEYRKCILDIVKRKNEQSSRKIKVFDSKIHPTEFKIIFEEIEL